MRLFTESVAIVAGLGRSGKTRGSPPSLLAGGGILWEDRYSQNSERLELLRLVKQYVYECM
jgi:hypothetical protein